jgi:hypothetical protein
MTPEEEYRSLRPQPSVRYIATGQEHVQKIRPATALKKNKKGKHKNRFESSSSEEEEEEKEEVDEDDKFIADKPREKVKL